jgi:hypothetical protein
VTDERDLAGLTARHSSSVVVDGLLALSAAERRAVEGGG